MQVGNTNTDADADANTYTNTNTNANADANINNNTYANAISNTDTDTDAHTNTNTSANANAISDSDNDADAGANIFHFPFLTILYYLPIAYETVSKIQPKWRASLRISLKILLRALKFQTYCDVKTKQLLSHDSCIELFTIHSVLASSAKEKI